MLDLLLVLPVAPWAPHRRQWNPTPRSWLRRQVQAVQVIFSNLIYQTINKWAQNISIFLLQLGLAFNWKDGLPQAHDMGFLPEIGLARQSASLNLHRFDSRKVVSWITCLSSFCIPAIFPRSHKWHPQSAISLGSTGMLNTQPPAWQELLLHHPDVLEVLQSHTCAPLQLLAGQILMGLSQGGHGDVCPAWTLLMEPVCHIRGDSAFPLASSGHLSRSVNCQYSWSYVLYRHANLSLEFALKHNLFQHNWVILFANSVTVFREKLRHNLGCPAVRPLPLENKVKYIMPGEKCHSFPLHPVSLNFCNVAEFHRQSQVYMFGQLNYKTTNLSIPVFSFLCFQFWFIQLTFISLLFFSHFCLYAVLYLQCLIESPGLLCVPSDQLYWKTDPYVNNWIYICSHCGSARGQPFWQCRSPGYSQHLVSAFHFWNLHLISFIQWFQCGISMGVPRLWCRQGKCRMPVKAWLEGKALPVLLSALDK